MGNVKSTFTSDIALPLTIKSRQKAFHKKARKDIVSELKSIAAKDSARSMHDPLHPCRPFGLAEGMEVFWRHIWDLVFAHVNDLSSIINLREVCKMFKELLERKYVAARLPEIIELCLEQDIIPWTHGAHGGRTEISNRVKTLSNLRVLSKSTKHSVDHLFDRGLLDDECWSRIEFPYFAVEYWRIPHFMFGPLDGEPMRLEKTLESLEVKGYSKDYFPVKAILFNEWRDDNLPFDRLHLRNGLQKGLEKIGGHITSFKYQTTNESSWNVYDNLRRWVALMPNLEELIVVFARPGVNPYFYKVSPFPACVNLKRYVEGYHGFGFPYINEIIIANPTIEEVLLGETLVFDLEFHNQKKLLDNLPLKTLHCTRMPTIEFLQYPFSWVRQLTTLILRDTTTTASPGIPSEAIFNSISHFKNLKNLSIMSTRIRGTGGYLNLPKLETLCWQIVPGFESLKFLNPLVSLQELAFDISSFPPEFRQTIKVREFLAKWHIPELFPGLRGIHVKAERNGTYDTVWKSLG